jgi:prepilin-type N-terminal cleavage/methylation domain-containing protein
MFATNNQLGFTLIEFVAVLIIFGILISVSVPRYIQLEEDANRFAIDAAVSELNARESLAWAQVKVSPNKWSSDLEVWNKMTTRQGYPDPGEDYSWEGNQASRKGQSRLSYRNRITATLIRTPSTSERPARWTRK